MARKYFLFDASAAVHYYIESERYKPALSLLFAKRAEGRAFFFLPTFCVAEVFNFFAKHAYRKHIIHEALYNEICTRFREHIHNRQVFYCYDLNRYHNLNLEWEHVYRTEHETDTEYQKLEINPATTNDEDVRRLYMEHFRASPSSHYLSGFDLLILGMAIELTRNFGERVYIVTRDNRLAQVAQRVLIKQIGSTDARPLKVVNLNERQCLQYVTALF